MPELHLNSRFLKKKNLHFVCLRIFCCINMLVFLPTETKWRKKKTTRNIYIFWHLFKFNTNAKELQTWKMEEKHTHTHSYKDIIHVIFRFIFRVHIYVCEKKPKKKKEELEENKLYAAESNTFENKIFSNKRGDGGDTFVVSHKFCHLHARCRCWCTLPNWSKLCGLHWKKKAIEIIRRKKERIQQHNIQNVWTPFECWTCGFYTVLKSV